MTLLQHLEVSANLLTDVSVVEHLQQLTWLDISSNMIQKLPEAMPKGLQVL